MFGCPSGSRAGFHVLFLPFEPFDSCARLPLVAASVKHNTAARAVSRRLRESCLCTSQLLLNNSAGWPIVTDMIDLKLRFVNDDNWTVIPWWGRSAPSLLLDRRRWPPRAGQGAPID